MAKNQGKSKTGRRTDMKQIRRISELAETAPIRLGKLSITEKCKRWTHGSVLL